MAKEKVAGLMSTEIGLNTTKATESLSQLKSAIKDSTNEWKQMESQMKASGDVVGASEVKYKGLTESVQRQQDVLAKLKQEQAEINRSTQAGEQVYQKYASDITKAERQLTSLIGQQAKAKQSYELQADGITELNQKIKQNDELTKLQTDRLDAEGNKTKAVARAKDGLATKIRLMNELYEKQSCRLKSLESSEDTNTEAIRKQRLALEKTATAISQAESNMKSLGHESHKASSTFSEVFKGTALAQGAIQAWGSVKNSIESAVEAGAEFNKEQDTMKTVWHALTTETPKDGKELVNFINDISNHSIYTADSVNDMAQAFYHVHSNVKETKNWTQDFINLGSTMHLTDAQLSESGETFAKIVAGGKVGAEDLNMMIDRFPMFGEAVQKASGKSMEELRQMSQQGKLTSDVFVSAMDELGSKYKDGQAEAMTSFQGMTMYLSKRKAQLFGEIEQSSFNISKKMKANILDITSDKSMEAYAKAISKAMSSVMGIVAKMIEYIRKHQKDIMQMISSVANIAGILGGAMWNTIKITFTAIAQAFGLIGTNANKAHDPLKTVNTALTNILAHKRDIQALGAVMVSAFAVKKLTDFGRGVGSTLDTLNSMREKVDAVAHSEKLATATQKALTVAQKAFNFALKDNPIGLVIVAITALVAGFVLLYKHNKKFRQFVDGLVKSAKQFFEGITKWFGNAWSSVTKGYNSFTRSFSKGWHSFTDDIGKAWNATWSYVSNVFDKYINIYKRIIKTFTDFFIGNWGNLGKDIRGIWNALWDYVESIFGKKAGSIKHGIENFGSSVWNLFGRIKDKVSGFWSDMWNGLKDFARDGINNVISVINNGIGGINTVIHTFGGKKEAIGKIPKFANGTKGAPKGLAIVNDAPGEHYQEAIIDNSGRATVLEGRNRLVNFSGGETVIPAHALPKFANGTDNWLDTAIGWIKDKWDKLTEFIAHPIKALGNVMNKAVSGIAGSPLVTNIAPAMANGLVQGIADPIVNLFKSLKKKHDDEGASAPAGSGVQRWKDLVIKALDKNGLSTSESMVNKVLRQIQSESGGNEKAVQGGYTDINTITGDLAKGLMQTISATFNAYAFPGHKNIFNGYDNLLAALAYAKNRYGSNLAGLGEGHGYAQGGIVSQHGFYEVAEQNIPEIIIPLDPAKKMRANELLAEANQRINGVQSQQVVVQSDTTQLEQKFDNVITLLSLMLGVNQDQLKTMQAQGGINLPNLMNQMGMAQATHNYQSI
ncbi:tape measure protein [Weissella confusa]|uniref:tape measure protein n=1 Tax=Weissella confusa TaxID=1583 RepID=UPI00107F527E|nr:tape measure protein [Weissella confusa]MBJ7654849.1 tape measure protein [Weissella confusa]TGE44663.1 hypothetical protein C6P25_02525 [Weissella confusa]